MNGKRIYDNLPIFVQNFLCNIKGWQINHTRLNSSFEIMLNDFVERGGWSYDHICEYRDKKLQELVMHCYTTVPYYKKTFDNLKLVPDDIKTIDDLKKLPIIDKQIINNNPEEFVSSKIKDYKIVHAHTSGTTGSGFKFITTDESIHAQWATFWRLYLNSGIKRGEKQATFSGQMIVPIKQRKPPFWRYVNSQNRVYFSAYHEQKSNMKYYYDELKREKISWLNGYPSLISVLADYIVENDLPNPGIKFVSTGAENLYDYQENLIRKAFEGAIFVQTYAQAECVSFASQDSNGLFWVDEDAAVTEFIPNENGTYDIVGTNLYNYAMPLLRYRVGDQAQIVIDADGRRIEKISGRREDYIYLPDGCKLGKLDTAFKDATAVTESQIFQYENYSVEIRVVLRNELGKKEAEEAAAWIKEATRDSIPISVRYVDSIERSNTQKLKYVVSLVKSK